MRPSARSPLLCLPLCRSFACSEDEAHGVIVEVRFGEDYEGDKGTPGDPVPAADVQIRAVPGDPPELVEYASGVADAQGRFVVEAIEPVEAILSADEPGSLGPIDCEWYGTKQVMLLDAGETIEIELDTQVCS